MDGFIVMLLPANAKGFVGDAEIPFRVVKVFVLLGEAADLLEAVLLQILFQLRSFRAVVLCF